MAEEEGGGPEVESWDAPSLLPWENPSMGPFTDGMDVEPRPFWNEARIGEERERRREEEKARGGEDERGKSYQSLHDIRHKYSK